jgi:hypothetical protein
VAPGNAPGGGTDVLILGAGFLPGGIGQLAFGRRPGNVGKLSQRRIRPRVARAPTPKFERPVESCNSCVGAETNCQEVIL